MITHRIHLPKFLDEDISRDFSLALADALTAKTVTLDFSAVEFAYPVGTLIAGREIRHFVRTRKDQRLVTMVAGIDESKPAHSFLNFIGFFDFVGISNKTKVGSARGSTSYVPIRRYSRAEVLGTKPEDSKSIHDAIVRQADELAAVLVGLRPESPTYKVVLYSLKEVIRNVFEHSGAQECFVTAQKWSNGFVEVGVIDEGVGIRASLQQAIACANDLEAIQTAIKPGVSRAMKLDEAQNQHGNSGFGLYVLSELGRCFGRFTLGSGSAALQIDKEESKALTVSFHGTFVGLKITHEIHDFSGVLDDIVSSGEADAEAAGIAARASRSSRSTSVE
ncbi:MAG TPA: hypothetical protein VK985_13435 [Rariglobus sp.]|nr:hypothetical protein [Rariglobus sp.]